MIKNYKERWIHVHPPPFYSPHTFPRARVAFSLLCVRLRVLVHALPTVRTPQGAKHEAAAPRPVGAAPPPGNVCYGQAVCVTSEATLAFGDPATELDRARGDAAKVLALLELLKPWKKVRSKPVKQRQAPLN